MMVVFDILSFIAIALGCSLAGALVGVILFLNAYPSDDNEYLS